MFHVWVMCFVSEYKANCRLDAVADHAAGIVLMAVCHVDANGILRADGVLARKGGSECAASAGGIAEILFQRIGKQLRSLPTVPNFRSEDVGSYSIPARRNLYTHLCTGDHTMEKSADTSMPS